jgi:hypothetical protein
LPVYEIEDVDDGQHKQNIVPVPGAGVHQAVDFLTK